MSFHASSAQTPPPGYLGFVLMGIRAVYYTLNRLRPYVFRLSIGRETMMCREGSSPACARGKFFEVAFKSHSRFRESVFQLLFRPRTQKQYKATKLIDTRAKRNCHNDAIGKYKWEERVEWRWSTLVFITIFHEFLKQASCSRQILAAMVSSSPKSGNIVIYRPICLTALQGNSLSRSNWLSQSRHSKGSSVKYSN